MATVSKDAIEQLEQLLAQQEADLQSLADDLAEVTQERDMLKAELMRARATQEAL